jgi:hypothetical protein
MMPIPMIIKNNPIITEIQRSPCPQQGVAWSGARLSTGLRNPCARKPRPRPIRIPGPG